MSANESLNDLLANWVYIMPLGQVHWSSLIDGLIHHHIILRRRTNNTYNELPYKLSHSKYIIS